MHKLTNVTFDKHNTFQIIYLDVRNHLGQRERLPRWNHNVKQW